MPPRTQEFFSTNINILMLLLEIACLYRTTASSSKVREKALLEKEKKDEADRLGRERWSRQRAEMLKAREREAEKQKVAQAAASAARLMAMEAEELREVERQLQMDRLEAQQRLSEPISVAPERYEVVICVKLLLKPDLL